MRFIRILATVIAASLCGCTVPQKNTAVATQLRILSYNIHHGEGTDGRLDLERIARVIRSANPDFVALQEVDDRTTRTGRANQSAELGKLTGMEAMFGQAMAYQGGGYGQAILSKWPIRSTRVYRLPQRQGREPRIAFGAETVAGKSGREFLFVSTHLDHEIEGIRIEQARELQTVLKTNKQPVVLAGDFNAGPESETLRTLAEDWVDSGASNAQPTIPSENPRRRIDYILVSRPSNWRVIQTRVLEEAVASDHRPVVTILELER